ncbi:P-type conjugative transfer protein TrbL [Pasteurella multocida]
MTCLEKKHKLILISVLVLVFILYSGSSFAETTILNDVTKKYKDISVGWAGTMKVAATFLFYSLGAISLAWTLGMLIIRRAEIGEVFGELIKFSVFFGFMNWLLRNVSQIGTVILSSLKQLASNAGGNVTPTNASDILGTGYDIMIQVGNSLSVTEPLDSIAAILIGLLILLALCIVAVNFVVTEISAYIVLYGGIFVLGFGGSRWTSEIAINYYKTLIGIGLQLMTIILLVGIGRDIIVNYVNQMNTGEIIFEEILIVLIASIFLVILITKLPPMIGGLITGATGSTSFGGATMALAGMATAMAAAATAMNAAASTILKTVAGNSVGATQAISEALKLQGNDKSQDTTPDVSNINTSSNNNSPDVSSNTQTNSGQDGYSGENSYQGDKGNNSSSEENSYQGDNISSREQSIDKDSAQDNFNQKKSQDSTPDVSEHATKKADKPRNFSERLKAATSVVGSQIMSDIKSTPLQIKDSLKQSVHDLGANSYMGRVAQRINSTNTTNEGTGSISGATENKSTSKMHHGKIKSSQIIDGIKKSQEW